MSEMIERVADAIGAVFAAEQERLVDAALEVDGSLSGIADEVMAKCARAAIEAMRELTEKMKACRVSLAWDREGYRYLDDECVAELWDEMIDAALADKNTISPSKPQA